MALNCVHIWSVDLFLVEHKAPEVVFVGMQQQKVFSMPTPKFKNWSCLELLTSGANHARPVGLYLYHRPTKRTGIMTTKANTPGTSHLQLPCALLLLLIQSWTFMNFAKLSLKEALWLVSVVISAKLRPQRPILSRSASPNFWLVNKNSHTVGEQIQKDPKDLSSICIFNMMK